MPQHLKEEWVSDQNLPLDTAVSSSYLSERVYWRCWTHLTHTWQASIRERLQHPHCPYCHLDTLTTQPNPGSLQALHPDLAACWHPNNQPLTPNDISPYSPQILQWTCPANSAHSWRESIAEYVQHAREGTPCPTCKTGWRTDTLRLFIEALQPHLNELTSSEIFLIAQQAGLTDLQGDHRILMNAILDKMASTQDLQAFIQRKQSVRSLARTPKANGLNRDDNGLPQLTPCDLLSAYQSPLLPIWHTDCSAWRWPSPPSPEGPAPDRTG